MTTKQRLVDEVHRVMAQRYRGENVHAACLYWAEATVVVLQHHMPSERIVLQAGTSLWPCADAASDDGIRPSHFGYVYEATDEQARRFAAAGLMPEMHAWAGVMSTQEIVDITTGFLITQARLRVGIEWAGPVPPSFLWSHEPPAGVSYEPNEAATRLAARMLANDSLFKRGGHADETPLYR